MSLNVEFFQYLLAFIAVLTVVVFIHEFGHFIVARKCGVKVQAFSIGFGREIVGFTDKHGTRWKLAWIPLGGYVKFIDDENSASVPSREALDKMSPDEQAGAFQKKPLAQKAAIVLAGPLFNIISAILIYFGMFWLIGTYGAEALVDEVIADSAAAKAGLRSGDRITAIDGEAVKRFSDLQRAVGPSAGRSLSFTIDRNGKTLTVAITPELRETVDPIGNKVQIGAIGIKRPNSELVHQPHGFFESIGLAFKETTFISQQIVTSIPKLPGAIYKVFRGQSQSELGGPVAIAKMTGQAAKSGPAVLIGWIAVFSIMLGIMNLLPIPLLDGGHLMFFALEAVRGKPLDEAKMEMSYRVGLTILGTMMLAATANDLGPYLSALARKLGLG